MWYLILVDILNKAITIKAKDTLDNVLAEYEDFLLRNRIIEFHDITDYDVSDIIDLIDAVIPNTDRYIVMRHLAKVRNTIYFVEISHIKEKER